MLPTAKNGEKVYKCMHTYIPITAADVAFLITLNVLSKISLAWNT